MEGTTDEHVAGQNQSTNTSGLAIAGTSSNNEPESEPKIFKLNVDCFDHLFEWLSLKELLIFRNTCKQMKAIIDDYIKLNYPRVLHKIICNQKIIRKFCQMRLDCLIRHLKISIQLTDTQIDTIKSILNHLESLVLCQMQIDETLLKYCPHLKYLSVQANTSPKMIIGTGNE